jgi:hypothetical protein
VSDEAVARHCPAEAVLRLEVDSGHAYLLHNWMLHRSGVNPSPTPRRAFTSCYMDGRTVNTTTGSLFPIVWSDAIAQSPDYLRRLVEERAALDESRASAEAYALSLLETNRALETSLREATAYARSLEEERARVRSAG